MTHVTGSKRNSTDVLQTKERTHNNSLNSPQIQNPTKPSRDGYIQNYLCIILLNENGAIIKNFH